MTEPVAKQLTYLPIARELVVERCAQHPFLLQTLCNRIYEHAAESGERTITPSTVASAMDEMVRDNEHFRTLWDYAQTHRRQLILTLCERLASNPDPVNLDLIHAQLDELRVRVERESQIGDDLEFLRELELIELDKNYRGGTYRIAVPLFGMWIQKSIDYDDTIGRAREEAESEYQ